MKALDSAARAVEARLPGDFDPAVILVLADVIKALIAKLKAICYPTPASAYAYLTRDFWLDIGGLRAARRRKQIDEAIGEAINKQVIWGVRDADMASLRVAIRGVVADRTVFTLPVLQALWSEV